MVIVFAKRHLLSTGHAEFPNLCLVTFFCVWIICATLTWLMHNKSLLLDKNKYADTKCSLKIWGFRKTSHLFRLFSITHSKKMKQNSGADVVFFNMFSFSDSALLCMFVLPLYVSVCACVCTCVIRSISQSSRRCCARCQRRTSSWTLLNTGLQRIITCLSRSTAWRSALLLNLCLKPSVIKYTKTYKYYTVVYAIILSFLL